VGGLGARDLMWFNVVLLVKWCWRLLVENVSLWKEVLKEKYISPTYMKQQDLFMMEGFSAVGSGKNDR
jgi:hypothetical protein